LEVNAVFWISVCVALAAAPSANADRLEGRVVGVSDGDTLTILTPANEQLKVRIAGIDAPEKKQPFGDSSKKRMSELSFGKRAVVDCYKRDRYQRSICTVSIGGSDVGLQMIRDGMAWHYKRFQKEQSRVAAESYARAEETARAVKAGLWRVRSPIAPWDWRAKVRPLEMSPPAE
jgi:endonuclease YncB( thermonuclease family)